MPGLEFAARLSLFLLLHSGIQIILNAQWILCAWARSEHLGKRIESSLALPFVRHSIIEFGELLSVLVQTSSHTFVERPSCITQFGLKCTHHGYADVLHVLTLCVDQISVNFFRGFCSSFPFFLDSMNARVFAMLWQGRDTPAAVVVGGDGDATSASSHKLIECAPVTGIECADGHGDESNAQSFSLPLPSSVSSNYAVGMFWSNFYIIFFESRLCPFHSHFHFCASKVGFRWCGTFFACQH